MSGLELAPKAHVELAPSSAKRWMNCPGSIEAERGLPDSDSIHSQEGTAAHALAEVAFQRDREAVRWVGETIEGIVVTEEMAEHVQTYVDALRDFAEGAEIVRIERRLTMPQSMRPPAEMGGTCDAWFYYPALHLLRVADLKYGKGVVVEVEEDGKPNPQLAYYAVLAWLDLHAESKAKASSVQEVELVVVQPRAFHADGPERSVRITIAELKAFARELLEAARRAMTPQAARQAGDWCRFCKAKMTCPAFRGAALEAAQVRFEDVLGGKDLVLANPMGLTPDQLGHVLRASRTLEAWISEVQKIAMAELERGRPVTGFALKPKRANRKWADEDAVLEWAKQAKVKKADLMKAPELKSPAQIESVVKKLGIALPETLVVRESSGYTLTTDDDPKAVVPTGLDAIEDGATPQST